MLPLLLQVVNETLRIANIISGVFRRAMRDVSIKGKKCSSFYKLSILDGRFSSGDVEIALQYALTVLHSTISSV